MDNIIVTEKLTKEYNCFPALKELDIEIGKGKIIGLLGPNGSGKTTLIKILAGLLTPTKGRALIDGLEPGVETKAIVSYLPERTYFNSWMRVDECLQYFQDFYKDFDRERAESMLRDLDVSTTAKLKTLSKGTKEKVQLVLVMARKAKLYLLDEPIAGVDPAARDYILDTIIRNYNPEATVIISTHLISDIEKVLDEYIFINKGVIVERGTAKSVQEEKGVTLDEHFREVFKCFQNS
ncbi:MAG: ABC transporter ATP-binding protein [Clostridia bacterium]|nr:ABC transporter ATP-binding protein [Clostridia bacterium]